MHFFDCESSMHHDIIADLGRHQRYVYFLSNAPKICNRVLPVYFHYFPGYGKTHKICYNYTKALFYPSIDPDFHKYTVKIGEKVNPPIPQKHLSSPPSGSRECLVWVSVQKYQSDRGDWDEREDDHRADDREDIGRGGL